MNNMQFVLYIHRVGIVYRLRVAGFPSPVHRPRMGPLSTTDDLYSQILISDKPTDTVFISPRDKKE